MHTAKTAHESLKFLWNNYVTLSEKVDLNFIPLDNLEELISEGASERPFRIAPWISRQGYYISAWSLWEYYARSLCNSMPERSAKDRSESTVGWVGRSLTLNNIVFEDLAWFECGNSLRNLIAHYGARATEPRSKSLLESCKSIFPDIDVWKDGYVNISHSEVADLQVKIEEFIIHTAKHVDE